MKNIILGILFILLIVMTFKFCTKGAVDSTIINEHSLIQKQISQVGKLVVTEGHFSEVFDYKNSKAILTDYISAEKKALVIVNAEVTVAYDLSKIEYNIDEKNKSLEIITIPSAEIKINPDLEYYDIQQGFLNPFDAKDYNTIKTAVNASISKKIEASSLKSNASDRLVSELSKFFILTNSLGWTLKYDQNPVNSLEELENLKF